MAGFSEVEITFSIVTGAAVVVFLVMYIVMAWGVHNEVTTVKRLQSFMGLLGWLLMVCYFASVYFEATLQAPISWTNTFGVLRPVVSIVCGLFYFFTTTHQLFRWITLLTLALFVNLTTLHAARLHLDMTCRSNSTCTNRAVFSVLVLQIQWVRDFVELFVSVCAFLTTAAMCVAQGWCSSRYPPRLFDASVPLSQLPPEVFHAPTRAPAPRQSPRAAAAARAGGVGTGGAQRTGRNRYTFKAKAS